MASGFEVTPERLRKVSAQMSTSAADVEAILSRLSRDVAPVRSEWVGAAQEQFNTLWDRLEHDASGLDSVLNGMAKLTESAAAAYEATELSIAQSFDAFRVEQKIGPAVAGGTDGTFVANGVGLIDTDDVGQAEVVVDHSMPGFDDADGQPSEIQDAPVDAVQEAQTLQADEVTEGEGSGAEEADRSVEQPKSGARLPWVRFMTKGAHSSDPEITIEPRRRERRFKAVDPNLKPGTRLCRLCFTVVALEPEYIETTETHVYVCCPYCGRSFPIRHSDVEALYAANGSDQSV